MKNSIDSFTGWCSRCGAYAVSGNPEHDKKMNEAEFVEYITGRRVGFRAGIPDFLRGLVSPLARNDFI